MSWDCGLRYMFSVPPALQQRSMCILHDKEDLSRLEMVQRLAKDGCRFLQNHSKGPERPSEVSKHHQSRNASIIQSSKIVFQNVEMTTMLIFFP